MPWWHGAAADRLLDARHAGLVERVVALLRVRGWEVYVELSFSEFGERGAIDIVGLKRTEAVAVVIEVKSALGSLEETNRVLDAKVRLAPTLVSKRYGWRPRIVGRLLVVPDTTSVRRVIDSHSATMDSIYPTRSREARAWLRRPTSALRAVWFLSDGPNTSSVSPQQNNFTPKGQLVVQMVEGAGLPGRVGRDRSNWGNTNETRGVWKATSPSV